MKSFASVLCLFRVFECVLINSFIENTVCHLLTSLTLKPTLSTGHTKSNMYSLVAYHEQSFACSVKICQVGSLGFTFIATY